ncbi:helix-turn-helix transcriptional regulator [Rhizorhabdus histidinilytica]|uniref:helix-turn-helix transcriptional regulator n=1 Tax=Rhizorhabdus histidinilytica TaxID=439228 RepID=UPI00322085DB
MTTDPTDKAPRPVRTVTPPAEGADKFLRRREVEDMTGYSKNSIYRKIRQGTFPAPSKGGASSRWSYREVEAWQERFKAGLA